MLSVVFGVPAAHELSSSWSARQLLPGDLSTLAPLLKSIMSTGPVLMVGLFLLMVIHHQQWPLAEGKRLKLGIQKRAALLKQKCQNKPWGHDSGSFVTAHNLMFCWNHKAASTTFFHVLNQTQRLDSSTLVIFTVVRHPIARLVSGYRDRLAIDSEPREYHKRRRGINFAPPTFAQFIQEEVIEKNKWMLMSKHCSVCQTSWDAVLKVETLDQDFEELQTLVPSLLSVQLDHLNSSWNKSFSRQNLWQVIRGHWLQLGASVRQEVLDAYDEDFELFDYERSF